jgi:hypothetical protein
MKNDDNFDKSKYEDEIFDLKEEITRLRGQVTYLQEELSSIEDEKDTSVVLLNKKIESLEQQLGEALFGKK